MDDADVEAPLAEIARDALCDGDAAVPAARAADADREVRLPLAAITRDEEVEQRAEPLEERLPVLRIQHLASNLLVEARLLLEARHEVRIRKETHVDHEVRFARRA